MKMDDTLVTIQIHKRDYEILKEIADQDKISIAHALTMQFSGWGYYKKKRKII